MVDLDLQVGCPVMCCTLCTVMTIRSQSSSSPFKSYLLPASDHITCIMSNLPSLLYLLLYVLDLFAQEMFQEYWRGLSMPDAPQGFRLTLIMEQALDPALYEEGQAFFSGRYRARPSIPSHCVHLHFLTVAALLCIVIQLCLPVVP